MKRRSEHLVRKRDGRYEFLRTTKLARSVHLALRSVGVDEDWRALEITTAVLTGLRCRQLAGGGGDESPVLTTSDLASAVQHVLVATGHPAAAVAFDAVAVERLRRRSVLAAAERGLAVTEGPATLAAPASLHNRLPRE
jgi:hypothetical protein